MALMLSLVAEASRTHNVDDPARVIGQRPEWQRELVVTWPRDGARMMASVVRVLNPARRPSALSLTL